ncbi:hypothetical protein DAPPUDRAFT_308021 [Daphnia pulex]|uniref:Peptidase S1 domain-containing protein n=1 Tax=Daphnia pulex TaxID=6669 RepID=E9H5F6_DAPPU|nr:hypothetical protein DAPPUDRAFT_308021 [Daphnia pulex]|eukprot:EFX73012.1 hypothetical protein DAPPUDRAFT_308021 [Daphnia pulex]
MFEQKLKVEVLSRQHMYAAREMHFALSIIVSLCVIGLAHSKSLAQFSPDGKGASVPTISIAGGTPAAQGELPYVVVLRLGAYLCGGSLIGPSHVLTAAYCLTPFTQINVTSFYVLINTLSVNGGGPNSLVKGVKKFIIHEKYVVRYHDNDLALLVLNSPVAANSSFLTLPTDPAATTSTTTTGKPTTKTTGKPTSTSKPTTTTISTKKTTTTKSTVKPTTTKLSTLKPTTKTTLKPPATTKPAVVTVKTTSKKPAAVLRAFSTYTNVSATIAGWGITSSVSSFSSTLIKANVTIVDNSKCVPSFIIGVVGPNMMCAAAAPGTGSCLYDSGGPVIANGVVVGITSYGNSCDNPGYTSVYTRVSAYVDWIQTTQANNPG